MEVRVSKLTSWVEVVNLARATVGKPPISHEPSDKFKRDILFSEHSPCRALIFRIELVGIPYFVSVHLVRHKEGVEHFVSTQRTDRTGEDRNKKPQDALVNHTMIANAQAIMNISHRRLCSKASEETRSVWQGVVEAMQGVDKTLANFMVPMCVYRGGICNEPDGCGLCPP